MEKQADKTIEALSAEQKKSLSWQFLDKITEIVNNKFSEADKRELQACSQLLRGSNVIYQHNVDLEITQSRSQQTTITREKSASEAQISK